MVDYAYAKLKLSMSIRIRKFRKGDAVQVGNIIKKGFRSIISDDYPKKSAERVLSNAKKDGIESVKCWATLNAAQFYSKFGFKKLKKLELKVDKNSIVFMEMEKML